MSFSFLNNLFDSLIPAGTQPQNPSNRASSIPKVRENVSQNSGAQQAKLRESSPMKIETTQQDPEQSDRIQISKSSFSSERETLKHLKVGDVFKHAYATVSAEMDKNRGFNVVFKQAGDKIKASSKIKGKSFLLRKNEVNRGKRHLKTKKQTVSRKVIKQKMLYDVRGITFEQAKLLNKIWEEYIVKILPQDRNIPKSDNSRYLPLLRADYHGAWIKIIGSKNKNDEGAEGIVIKETLKTFVVCTESTGIKTFIKEFIVFGVRVNKDWFKILGLNIIMRADDRSKFKPKWKNPLPKLEGVLEITPRHE